MALAAFSAYVEAHPEIDVALDERLAARTREGEVVLESRLAGWIVTNERLNALRVWLHCDEETRGQRVATRDALDMAAARAANRSREQSERVRYRACYGVDLDDQAIYDLVLDSAIVGSEDLATTIVAAAHERGGT